jgi:hypothetical protein
LARRGLLAHRRRERSLQDYRVEDRRRQRECRERKRVAREAVRGAIPVPEAAVPAAVSRAGLDEEVTRIVGVALEFWDETTRRSRAGLRRNLVSAIRRSRETLGQVTT